MCLSLSKTNWKRILRKIRIFQKIKIKKDYHLLAFILLMNFSNKNLDLMMKLQLYLKMIKRKEMRINLNIYSEFLKDI